VTSTIKARYLHTDPYCARISRISQNAVVVTNFEGICHLFEIDNEEDDPEGQKNTQINPITYHRVYPNMCTVLIVDAGAPVAK
jgi:hypothetical protein